MRPLLSSLLSLILHTAGLSAAWWLAASSILAPDLRVQSGRTAIALQASVAAHAPADRPPEPIRLQPSRQRKPVEVLPEEEPSEQLAATARQTQPSAADAAPKLELAMLPEELARPTFDDAPERRTADDVSPTPLAEAAARPRKQAVAAPPPEPAVAPSVASMAAEAAQGAAVDELPQKLPTNPSPPYPAEAAGVEGRVVLYVVIGDDGRPESVTIHESSGSVPLDHSALRTVRDAWRFRPAYRAGVPVPFATYVPVRFQIRR
ncbi:MAG: hypothetical protein C0483_15250 [Pirellula sp.]|nr:hypothetical protein [Pirellula sp.]